MHRKTGDLTFKREIWIDNLRCAGIVAVIVIHSVSHNQYKIGGGYQWIIATLIEGFVRWAVPIFLMISGAFNLNPDRVFSFEKMKQKSVRIFVAFILWSSIYALIASTRYMISHAGGFPVGKFFNDFFIGHFHMWYCWLILALYLLTPLLREITKDRNLLKYGLICIAICSFTIPYLEEIFDIPWLSSFIKNVPDVTHVGFIGYYLLGYYLYSREIDKKSEYLCYALGTLGMAIAVGGTIYSSYISGEFSGKWAYTSLPLLLQSIGVFVLFKNRADKPMMNKNFDSIKVFVSKQTFGIYLIHVFWMELLFVVVGRFIQWMPIVVGFVAVGTFVLTTIQVFVMSKIPIVRKYLL